MHKSLVVATRYFGDIKLSINGEAKVAFNVNDIWSNSIVQTISSDQGALYPFGEGSCAIRDVRTILSGLTLVPFQNDERYERNVTEKALHWLNTEAWYNIREGFEDPAVYKVTTRYYDEDSFEPTIVICAELMVNDYCLHFEEAMRDAVLLGEIHDICINDLDNSMDYLVAYTTPEGTAASLTVPMDGPVMFVGVNSCKDAKYCFKASDDSYILSNLYYDVHTNQHGKEIII